MEIFHVSFKIKYSADENIPDTDSPNLQHIFMIWSLFNE